MQNAALHNLQAANFQITYPCSSRQGDSYKQDSINSF